MTQADIKNFSTTDLVEKIKEEKTVYSKLKLNHSVSPIESPVYITRSRKTVARLKTEFRARQIAETKK